MLTRFAPTPSGYQHVGNLVNYVLTDQHAKTCDARIALRIDDADRHRYRPEYLADIFEKLNWLGLSWQIGPREVADWPRWSAGNRTDQYVQARNHLLASGAAYACVCSRSDWARHKAPGCPRGCRSLGVAFEPGRTTVRLSSEGMDHVTVWRREDLPAYQLASVVDDDRLGVTLVVRGADLAESTEIQRRISTALPSSSFHEAEVIHHPLVTGSDGAKLAKSAGSNAAPLQLTSYLREQVHRLAEEFRETMTLRTQNRGS